jgi:hypothetical protein
MSFVWLEWADARSQQINEPKFNTSGIAESRLWYFALAIFQHLYDSFFSHEALLYQSYTRTAGT